MTEPDIRKLRELLKTHKVTWKIHGDFYEVISEDVFDEIYIGYGGNFDQIDPATMELENFYVTIPLTQVKKGLQPL